MFCSIFQNSAVLSVFRNLGWQWTYKRLIHLLFFDYSHSIFAQQQRNDTVWVYILIVSGVQLCCAILHPAMLLCFLFDFPFECSSVVHLKNALPLSYYWPTVGWLVGWLVGCKDV